jgi:hypothetical protein
MDIIASNRTRCLAAACGALCTFLFISYGAKAGVSHSLGLYSEAIGQLLVAFYAMLGLCGIVLIARDEALARSIAQWVRHRHLPIMAALIVCVSIPLLVFGCPIGWDESAHVLSGMHIRGYQVPHELHRSPGIQILAALTFPFVTLINPLLLLALGGLMILWCRRFSDPILLFLIIPLLLANKHFVFAVVEIMGELPATVFLVASYYFLARNKFLLGAVCLSLAVLSRWNLLPLAVIPVLYVAIRVSLRQATLMALIGLVFFAIWVLWIGLIEESPVDLLLGYISHKAPRIINPLTRLEFYTRSFYYLSPLGLCAVIASPFIDRSRHHRVASEIFRFVLPAAILLYLAIILTIGNFVPRLLVPLISLSLLLFAELFRTILLVCRIPLRSMAIPLLTLLPLSSLTVTRDYEVAEAAARKVFHSPLLPTLLVEEIRTLPPEIGIYMPPYYKISNQSGGRELRILLRRNVTFHPDDSGVPLEVIFSRSLDDEISDFESHVDEFLASVPPDMHFLLPARYKESIDQQAIVFEDEGWILGRFE